jgi:hypothetical protein
MPNPVIAGITLTHDFYDLKGDDDPKPNESISVTIGGVKKRQADSNKYIITGQFVETETKVNQLYTKAIDYSATYSYIHSRTLIGRTDDTITVYMKLKAKYIGMDNGVKMFDCELTLTEV